MGPEKFHELTLLTSLRSPAFCAQPGMVVLNAKSQEHWLLSSPESRNLSGTVCLIKGGEQVNRHSVFPSGGGHGFILII